MFVLVLCVLWRTSSSLFVFLFHHCAILNRKLRHKWYKQIIEQNGSSVVLLKKIPILIKMVNLALNQHRDLTQNAKNNYVNSPLVMLLTSVNVISCYITTVLSIYMKKSGADCCH